MKNHIGAPCKALGFKTPFWGQKEAKISLESDLICLLLQYHVPSLAMYCRQYWQTPSSPPPITAQDCISAESDLSDTHFIDQHTYGLYIEPGEWIAWYLEDVLLFNVTKEALSAKVNPQDPAQSVGPREVPREPMYMILNVASSEFGFMPRDPDLPLPANMTVDWVRLYQSRARHSVGCDPAAYPTKKYIAKKAEKLNVRRCGDGVCQADECKQCPRDCLRHAACRQDCRVPRCQIRESNLTNPMADWTFQVRHRVKLLKPCSTHLP